MKWVRDLSMIRLTVEFDAPNGKYCSNEDIECSQAHDYDNLCIAFNSEIHYEGARRLKCRACLAACAKASV